MKYNEECPFNLTLEDLTIEKVKAAYEKTGLTPAIEGKGCALDAIARSQDLWLNSVTSGWQVYRVYDLGHEHLEAFVSGFDGCKTLINTKFPEYYKRGQEIARAVL